MKIKLRVNNYIKEEPKKYDGTDRSGEYGANKIFRRKK